MTSIERGGVESPLAAGEFDDMISCSFFFLTFKSLVNRLILRPEKVVSLRCLYHYQNLV